MLLSILLRNERTSSSVYALIVDEHRCAAGVLSLRLLFDNLQDACLLFHFLLAWQEEIGLARREGTATALTRVVTTTTFASLGL